MIGAATPLSLSEIAERLGISRGNASMCLKELRAWGVVQKVAQPADRQDWYVSRGDLFRQTIAIARQRKRREFDPVADAALAALGDLSEGASPEQADADPRDRGVPDRARPRRPRGARRREGRTRAGRAAAAQLRPPEGGVMALWKRWFGFTERVDPRAYALTGLSLMAFKYAIDALSDRVGHRARSGLRSTTCLRCLRRAGTSSARGTTRCWGCAVRLDAPIPMGRRLDDGSPRARRGPFSVERSRLLHPRCQLPLDAAALRAAESRAARVSSRVGPRSARCPRAPSSPRPRPPPRSASRRCV